MNLFLQIFLYFDIFIIGIVFEVVIRHAYAHYHHEVKPKPTHPVNEVNRITQAERVKLLEESEDKYRQILQHSSDQLSKDLNITAERINTTVKKLAADIITKELEGFQELFKNYEQKAVSELEEAKTQTDHYQNDLRVKVEQEAAAEKQRLIDLIDNKLADSVMGFLTEAMQHEIDLGSQTKYLLSLLDEHKEELKKAIDD